MDCSPPGSSVHGVFQARVLEWGAVAFSISIGSSSSRVWRCLHFSTEVPLDPSQALLGWMRDTVGHARVFTGLPQAHQSTRNLSYAYAASGLSTCCATAWSSQPSPPYFLVILEDPVQIPPKDGDLLTDFLCHPTGPLQHTRSTRYSPLLGAHSYTSSPDLRGPLGFSVTLMLITTPITLASGGSGRLSYKTVNWRAFWSHIFHAHSANSEGLLCSKALCRETGAPVSTCRTHTLLNALPVLPLGTSFLACKGLVSKQKRFYRLHFTDEDAEEETVTYPRLGFLTAWKSQRSRTSYIAADFFQNKHSKRSRSWKTSYDPASEVMQHHFCHIRLVT
ncbi:hypothetical protein MG293_000611 [Ovis ammon polii]|uniref:Uncharacterized protein n=1 Tax=Ovis ammon polii TaxID=230172 RepID=A0AAD4UN66_OVIAM|nr:hypothetical protein MG293_000611 [Ovis ammon polii]